MNWRRKKLVEFVEINKHVRTEATEAQKGLQDMDAKIEKGLNEAYEKRHDGMMGAIGGTVTGLFLLRASQPWRR